MADKLAINACFIGQYDALTVWYICPQVIMECFLHSCILCDDLIEMHMQTYVRTSISGKCPMPCQSSNGLAFTPSYDLRLLLVKIYVYIRSTPPPVRVEKYIATCQGLKKKHQKIIDFWVTKMDPQFRFWWFYLFIARAKPATQIWANTKNMIPPLTFPHPSPFPSASHTTIQKHSTVIRFKLEVVKL